MLWDCASINSLRLLSTVFSRIGVSCFFIWIISWNSCVMSSSSPPHLLNCFYWDSDFFKTSYFVLGCSWWTILWKFQVTGKGTQPYIYTYPFSLKPSFHLGWLVTLSGVPCAIYSSPFWSSILNIAVCTWSSQTS